MDHYICIIVEQSHFPHCIFQFFFTPLSPFHNHCIHDTLFLNQKKKKLYIVEIDMAPNFPFLSFPSQQQWAHVVHEWYLQHVMSCWNETVFNMIWCEWLKRLQSGGLGNHLIKIPNKDYAIHHEIFRLCISSKTTLRLRFQKRNYLPRICLSIRTFTRYNINKLYSSLSHPPHSTCNISQKRLTKRDNNTLLAAFVAFNNCILFLTNLSPYFHYLSGQNHIKSMNFLVTLSRYPTIKNIVNDMLHVTRPETSCGNQQCHYATSMFIFLPYHANTST